MKSRRRATLIGLIAVFVWGFGLPVSRFINEQVGFVYAVFSIFGLSGVIGITHQLFVAKTPPPLVLLKNPALYFRLMFFIGHEICVHLAMFLCSKQNLAFVILLNYLWPTCVLLCSILLGELKITRWLIFISGCTVVLLGLTNEVVGIDSLTLKLFENRLDCIAYLIVILGAISWGMFSALSRKYEESGGGSAVMPYFQLIVALCALLFLFFPEFRFAWDLTLSGYVALFCISLGALAAFYSWDYGMRKGNVVVLSLFADFIPWLSLFSAHLLVSVNIGIDTITSAVVLVIGAMITRAGTAAGKSA